MLSKVLSFILYYPQIVLPVCGVAIAYLSVYKKRPIKTRFLLLPILVVVTFLLSLIDNPFSDRTYSGLLFVFYNVYVFTPLSVACSITSLLKSIYHYRLFRIPLATILVINASIIMEKELAENPRLNVDAVRTMMSAAGQKPNEARVRQTYNQIIKQQKQALANSKKKKK